MHNSKLYPHRDISRYWRHLHYVTHLKKIKINNKNFNDEIKEISLNILPAHNREGGAKRFYAFTCWHILML